MGTKSRAIRASLSAIVICLLVMLPVSNPTTAKSRFSGIVVFGTTLSDSGNAFAILGEAGTPPDYEMGPFLIPTVPYARGGHHLSNGDTWIEQVGKSLGLGGSVRPALQGSAHATNYAVGAARARDVANNFTLTLQVSTFLLDSGGVADPDALYVIEMGGNDVRDAFAAALAGGDGNQIIIDALTSILVNVTRLYDAGARQFLVMNVPNIALTPSVRALGPAAGVVATGATQAFNDGLAGPFGVLDQLSALPGSSFELLDAFQLLNVITANPSAFGLTNVEDACVTPDIPPFKCQKPDQFLFWDGIHPTKVGHALLAEAAAAVLFP